MVDPELGDTRGYTRMASFDDSKWVTYGAFCGDGSGCRLLSFPAFLARLRGLFRFG